MQYDAHQEPEVDRPGMSTEAERSIDLKKQLMRRRRRLHNPLKHSCHSNCHLSISTSRRNDTICFIMSTTQRASPASFCPPHEELASFELAGIVDYLKEGPSSFDIHQNNDISCDPRNGK
jgi:hypothetical protein